jgi:hypothetical protein
MLLAVQVTPDGRVRTLGSVVAMTPTIPAYDHETVEIRDRTVLVELTAEYVTNGGPRAAKWSGPRRVRRPAATARTRTARPGTGWAEPGTVWLHEGRPAGHHENGMAVTDELTAGRVDDQPRIDHLRDHLVQAHGAIRAGVRLESYHLWSLMDNFEWAEGYGQRWGIVYVDYASQRRIPKASAGWYRDVIARNGV